MDNLEEIKKLELKLESGIISLKVKTGRFKPYVKNSANLYVPVVTQPNLPVVGTNPLFKYDVGSLANKHNKTCPITADDKDPKCFPAPLR